MSSLVKTLWRIFVAKPSKVLWNFLCTFCEKTADGTVWVAKNVVWRLVLRPLYLLLSHYIPTYLLSPMWQAVHRTVLDPLYVHIWPHVKTLLGKFWEWCVVKPIKMTWRALNAVLIDLIWERILVPAFSPMLRKMVSVLVTFWVNFKLKRAKGAKKQGVILGIKPGKIVKLEDSGVVVALV